MKEEEEQEGKGKKKEAEKRRNSKEEEDRHSREAQGEIQVVAHSNGGLITLCALNAHPELFHSVVFVGTPFSGGIGMLSDLHVGSPIGLNKRLFAKPVSFSFPTSYVFFPTDPTQSRLIPYTPTLDPTHHRHHHLPHLHRHHHHHHKESPPQQEEEGQDACQGEENVEDIDRIEEDRDDIEQLRCDFYDVAAWKENRWGLYFDESSAKRKHHHRWQRQRYSLMHA